MAVVPIKFQRRPGEESITGLRPRPASRRIESPRIRPVGAATAGPTRVRCGTRIAAHPEEPRHAERVICDYTTERTIRWIKGLRRLRVRYDRPGVIMDAWRILAASPEQNGFIESFHGRLRDEFLERVEFESVADARAKATWFRREYNTIRPHSSIGYKTPREFSEECSRRGSISNAITCNIDDTFIR